MKSSKIAVLKIDAHGQAKSLRLKITANGGNGVCNFTLQSCPSNIICGTGSDSWNFEFDAIDFDKFNEKFTQFLNSVSQQFERDARAYANGNASVEGLLNFYNAAPAFGGSDFSYTVKKAGE